MGLGVVIPILGFILQSYPRLFNRSFGVDVWTRLLEIEAVRNANHRIPKKVKKGFIIEGEFDYPPVFPFIFSFLSRKTILKYQGFISPLIDSLQTLLVFIVSYQVTQSMPISLLAQLVYILTPMIVVENSYLTPRSLGYLCFTIAFYPLVIYLFSPSTFVLCIGIATGVLLFLTHRFALQSYFFLCIFMFAVTTSIHFIAVPILSFMLSVIITRGYYLKVIYGHLSNIYFWVINYKYRFAHQVYGLRKNKKEDWVASIYKLLSEFSPIFLLFTNMWAASAFIYLYITASGVLDEYPIFSYFALWIGFFYVMGAIVLKFKFLIPIGEGQRYLEMSTLPASILTSYLVFYFYNIYGLIVPVIASILLFGNLALIIFIQIKGVIKDKNRSLTPELEKMYSYINKLPGKPRIICIPHQITTMTVFNTKAEILVNADNPGLMRLSKFFPILAVPLSELKKEYKLDFLLLRESFAKEKDLVGRGTKVVYQISDIKLIRL